MIDGMACPKCNTHQAKLRKWQTAEGEWGAVSVVCEKCEWVGILPLSKAEELVIP